MVLQASLGWDIMPTVAALALAAAIITMVGGFAVVAYTDAIHTPIMIVGSAVVLMIGLHQVGGWEGLLRWRIRLCPRFAMPCTSTNPMTTPISRFGGHVLGAVYGGTFYWGVDQVNVQRMLGAKNLDHARWARCSPSC